MKKFLVNIISLIIYSIIFLLMLCVAMPTFSIRENIGFALILGFFAGIINDINRNLIKLLNKDKEKL